MQADVLNARVVTALADAGPAFGAAIIAGAGVGVFPSIPEAVQRLVQVRDPLEPDLGRVDLYRSYHRLYDDLYPALQVQYKTLSRLLTLI
jgi:sugar (pentulose or hexulose) kinase